MLLEKPAFSVNVEIITAEETVSRILDSKGYNNYQFGRVYIKYLPYYFFSYDIYDESSGKTKIIAKGHSAFNAFTNEIAHELSDLAVLESGIKSPEITHDYKYEVVSPRISERDVKKIILVALSAEKNASKNNVIISGIELVFVPFWVLEYTLDEINYVATMNAVTKELIDDGNPPLREKTKRELLREAYVEMFNLRTWFKYISSFISSITDFFLPNRNSKHNNKHAEQNLLNDDFKVIVIAIIAIIVVFFLVYKL
jgi:hypothetical protein